MKAKTKGAVTVIAAAVLGVLALAFFRSAPVEAAWPAERAAMSFRRKVASRLGGMWRGAECAAENIRLRREVDTMAMDRADYDALASENARLRAALGYVERERGAWIAAEVLSTGGGAAAATATLRAAKGSLDGVEEGAAVAVPEGLVGRVRTVTPHTCDILLLSDPSFKVACVVEGEENLQAIVSGEGGDSLIVRHMKAGAAPQSGARISTSGHGGIFPAGIAVGSFVSLDDGGDEQALEREGTACAAVDPEALEDVFIRKR